MSYGDFGYGYEDNYGYDSGSNWSHGQNSGNGYWGGQGGRSRKRRGNFNQLQQFEQSGRKGRYQKGWGDRKGWGKQENDWGYGNDSYDDYGGSRWENDDYYDDGYGTSRKRSRFYDDDTRGGQYLERGPHSVNFYDDYDDTNFYRSEPPRRKGGRRNDGGRRRDSDYSWHREERDRRSDAYSRRSERRIKPKKKSDAEDAIYEKHKKVTVERVKRDKIGHAVHAVVQGFKEVAQRLAQEKYDEEKAAAKQTEDFEDETIEEDKATEEPAMSIATTTDQDASSGMEIEEDPEKQEETENKEDQDNSNEAAKKEKTNGAAKPTRPSNLEPVLLSSIKCGESAMRILVGQELQATVVVVSKNKPTRRLLERCLIILEEVLGNDKKMKQEVFFLEFDNENEALVLKLQALDNFKVLIRFTSPQCSPDYEPAEGEKVEDPLDVLTPGNCAAGLTHMRRMRFFVKRLDASPMCLTVLRILLYFRGTVEGWEKMPVWMTLLLVDISRNTLLGDKVEKIDPEKERDQCHVDTLLIRFLQILSSGVLMPNNPGVKDPCEENKDAGASLSVQDAETITRSAGHLLRRIYYGDIRTILGLEEG